MNNTANGLTFLEVILSATILFINYQNLQYNKNNAIFTQKIATELKRFNDCDAINRIEANMAKTLKKGEE